MQRQSASRSAFLTPRGLVALLFFVAACLLLSRNLPGFARSGSANVSQRTLTFEERVAYQRAIEDVYWHHRIWPKENHNPKPSLDAVMTQAQLEKKVTDYLRKSQALEDHWQRPITTNQLQAEMDRMAQHTKQPEVLQQLFEALGNDPFVIAECLARPALAERLLTNWYAYDQSIHNKLRERAKADLLAHPAVEHMKQLSGNYSETELISADTGHEEDSRVFRHKVEVNGHEWDETVRKLAAMFGDRRIAADVSHAKAAAITQIKTGVLSPLQEDETHFYAATVIEKTDQRLKLATVSWLKESLELWLARAENQVNAETRTQSTGYRLPIVSEERLS